MFQGHLKKTGRFWLVEVPSLDVMTQGHSRAEALVMIKDAIEGLVDVKGFSVDVDLVGARQFMVSACHPEPLFALMLKRQRSKRNLSLSDMKRRLHLKSRSGYAQYEQGRHMPSVTNLNRFLEAMGVGGLSIDIVPDETTESTHVRDL